MAFWIILNPYQPGRPKVREFLDQKDAADYNLMMSAAKEYEQNHLPEPDSFPGGINRNRLPKSIRTKPTIVLSGRGAQPCRCRSLSTQD